MYRVKRFFIDLKDKNHEYNVGDEYPRKGHNPTKARIEELAGENNKQGAPVIELVEDEKTPDEKDGKSADEKDGKQADGKDEKDGKPAEK